jgi:hypothetical protein
MSRGGGALSKLMSRSRLRANNVVAGGGVAAGAILYGLARLPNPGMVLAITRGDRWPEVFPRHHRLGQSRQSLTLFPHKQFHDPKGKMTAEEHLHELVDYQMEAVAPFEGDSIDCLETELTRVVRLGAAELLLTCADGSEVVTCPSARCFRRCRSAGSPGRGDG